MATISISQLDTATQAKVDDLYEVAVVDENSQTGYASRKLTAAQIATLIAQGIQFSGLSTEAKTIIAAINEAAQNGGTEVEANPAGEPTDTLETIGIDGTVYEVGGSEPVSKTVTGNPINIADAADAPIVSGEVTFEPQQDLHGYDKPWVEGAGKNKCPYDNVSFTSGNNWCDLTGDAAGSLLQGSQVALKAGTYYISMPTSTNIDTMQVADSNENILVNSKNGSFTLATDETIYIRIKQWVSSQPTTCKIQIELGSTATEYEPYSNICPIEGYTDCELEVTGNDVWVGNDTYTSASSGYLIPSTNISLSIGTYAFDFDCSNPNGLMQFEVFKNNSQQGANRIYNSDGFNVSAHNRVKFTINEAGTNLRLYANNSSGASISNVRLYSTVDTYTIDLDGTRYGGTVDLVSGEMRVTDVVYTYSSADVTLFEDRYVNVRCALINKQIDAKCYNNYDVTGETSNKLFNGSTLPIDDIGSIGSFKTNASTSKYFIILPKDVTLAEAQTIVDGLQFCYELATPFTVQLTPQQIRTLQGTNNISTNMTTMSLEYITQDYQSLVKLIEMSAGHHYSEQERVVGTWIDGKPLYEKTVDIENLPNNTTVNVAHGISDISLIVSISGFATGTTNTIPLPYSSVGGTYNINLNADTTNINIQTGYNASAYSGCVTLRYTKNTD